MWAYPNSRLFRFTNNHTFLRNIYNFLHIEELKIVQEYKVSKLTAGTNHNFLKFSSNRIFYF